MQNSFSVAASFMRLDADFKLYFDTYMVKCHISCIVQVHIRWI